MTQNGKLQYELPSKKSKGYLRRNRVALELLQALKEEPDPEVIDNMVAFLSPLVTNPTDPNEVVEALMDATEEEIEAMLMGITGGAQNPT